MMSIQRWRFWYVSQTLSAYTEHIGAGIILRAGGPTAYSTVGPENRFDMRRPG